MSKVFVSYKRVDKDKVFPIVRQMESKLGIKFWVDLEGIDGDMQFSSVIINAIYKCEVFLFMYSKAHEKINDYEYDYTVRELNFAHELRKRLVFIEVEETKLPFWFIFNFPQRQVTKANDDFAMDKLVADIIKWLHLPQPNPSLKDQGEAIGAVSVPQGNASLSQIESSYANKPQPEAIDLGLPSGTKWASCNVGATKPEEYGDYYAWGETDEKTAYNWDTYIHCDGSSDTSLGLGSNIAGTQYDVAHVKWGGSWQMPTVDLFKELFDYCHHKWTTLNGVRGYQFTSKFNGNRIFLPATGYRWEGSLRVAGNYGYYWSSTQHPLTSYRAYHMYFNSDYAYWDYDSRYYGRCVRPVSRV